MTTSTRLEQVQALSKHINKVLDELGSNPPPAVAEEARHKLFGEYARQWNTAEAVGESQILDALKELRPLLKIRPPKFQGLPAKISMGVRLLLTFIIVMWGSLWLVLLGPLRLLHPVLRNAGIPNGKLPMDVLTGLLFRAVLAAMGIKVRVDDGSVTQWGNKPCGIIVYNHGSNLDPFVVNLVTRWCASPKYIGKKDLFKIPLFGWLSLIVGMVPINRGDRDKALKAMNENAAGKMRDWGRCVAISPEGTRSMDGHLILPFKKGVFYLEEQTGAPLMPVVIHDAFSLWPPSQPFTSTGELKVSILPPQRMPEGDKARDNARIDLQRTYAQHLEKHLDWTVKPLSVGAIVECVAVLITTAVAMVSTIGALRAIVWMFGLGAWGMLVLLLTVSLAEAWWVDHYV